MELLSTLRRIRACEGEAAAQLLLESYVAQSVAAELERCAEIVDVPAGIDGWEVIGGQETMDLLRELAAKIRGPNVGNNRPASAGPVDWLG